MQHNSHAEKLESDYVPQQEKADCEPIQTNTFMKSTGTETASCDNKDPSDDTLLFWPCSRQTTEATATTTTNTRLPNHFLDSIVKIYCTHNEPDFLMPWQRQHPTSSTSSGFCIALPPQEPSSKAEPPAKLRIMTNAHSVEYASLVQVQRRGDDRKYTAVVETRANECDLAILRVEDDMFFGDSASSSSASRSSSSRIEPLPLGPTLPVLQDTVQVVGYPTGGDALSITQGVVSRVEQLEYTQGCTRLLALQIDAAINAGNSGGPVLMQQQQLQQDASWCVVGVAFQGLEGAENIGYVIPNTVVQHVLHDVRRNGAYTGFLNLGIRTSRLENASFRKSLAMMEGDSSCDSGVMVESVPTSSPCHGILQPNDVILSVDDDIRVANDGKIPFRPGERVALSCYIQTKFLGDTMRLQLWRNGQHKEETVVLRSVPRRLVPTHWGSDGNQPPPYLVVAGLVFTALSVPYLQASDAWGSYASDSISYLLGKWHEPQLRSGDQVVVLAQVLAHAETNLGYEQYGDLHLVRVNGCEIRSLRHLQSLIGLGEEGDASDGTASEYVRFEFGHPGYETMVLDRSKIQQATDEVCEEHGIQNPFFFFDG